MDKTGMLELTNLPRIIKLVFVIAQRKTTLPDRLRSFDFAVE